MGADLGEEDRELYRMLQARFERTALRVAADALRWQRERDAALAQGKVKMLKTVRAALAL